ncbi:MAG TPA: amino acid ABC transporter permease [Acidimicrobiia bacterium]|nr:amino acid ABC transporter permease [Acidimicrobiia bacterium]
MVALTAERVGPPDRGLRYFLRNQTKWSAAVLAAGTLLLLFIIAGSLAVLTHYGWTQVCPPDVTRLECSPSDPLAAGITSRSFALVSWIALAASLVVAVAGFVTFRWMPTKPAREATISGAWLAVQVVAIAAIILWFRGTDVDRFARNFLNLTTIGSRVGLVWSTIVGSVGSILMTALGWGAVTAGLAGLWVRFQRAPARIIVWAGLAGAGAGAFWGILATATARSFANAAKNTLVLSVAGGALGFGLGLVLALFTMSKRRVVRAPARIYVNFFRGTPLIWQISFAGIGVVPALRVPLSMYTIAILVLGLNLAAYSAEVYRAGIQSLDRGQMEAPRSLGLTYFQSMRFVIVPQAIRRVIPPLLNEFVILIKDTSLVSVLGLTLAQKELLGFGRDIYSSTFDATAFLGSAAGYMIITIPMIRIVTIVERRLRSGLTSVIG